MLFCLGLSGRITQISNILCASASLREKSTDEFRFNVQPPSYNNISDFIGFIQEYTHEPRIFLSCAGKRAEDSLKVGACGGDVV